ncbi:MAG TPA: hypothetical protein VKG26_00555 [Bacteroidia bacterium]|nr:hypothetical protein [Bacteroidia bacterium]
MEVTQVQLTDNFDDYKLSDTFHILENYPDPFLSEVIHVAKESSAPKMPLSKPIEKPVVANWPSISYKGIIKSLSTGKEIILIYINDRGYKMSQGNKQGDLILEKVYKDSVIMSMSNLKKTIKK